MSQWSEDLIPDVGSEPGASGQRLDGVDWIKANHGVVDLYTRWIGKMTPNAGTRTESIMCSCPKPDHPDKNPSAWLNSEKQTWFCGGCQEGGDVIDFAAFNQGYAVPDYRSNKEDFATIVAWALEDLGFIAPAPEIAPEDELDDLDEDEEQSEDPAGSDDIPAEGDDPVITALGGSGPEFNWREFLSPDSVFLKRWMELTVQTQAPDAFAWWLGMQILGMVGGRRIFFAPNHHPAYPNLFICLIGPTGGGKSTAVSQARRLLQSAMPFDETDEDCTGVKVLSRPASGEALYEAFDWVPDLNLMEPKPVKGWVAVDEFSELATAARRSGSILNEAIIALYDGQDIDHRSRGKTAIKAVNPFMGLVAGLQPQRVDKVLSGDDVLSGFMNRFNFVYGPKKPTPTFEESLKVVDFSPLDGTIQNIKQWAESRTPQHVQLTTDAQHLYDALLGDIDALREDNPAFVRFDLHLKKLIVILCLDEKTITADVDLVHRAWSILAATSEIQNEVSRAASMSEISKALEEVQRAIKQCRRRDGEWPRLSDIRKSARQPVRGDEKILLDALRQLMQVGVVAKIDPTTKIVGRGRKAATRYKLA